MPRTSVLDAALDYARQGYRVHPLRPGTKVPLLPAWQDLATTDADTIATWFLVDHPGANLGIATGRESDLWVLDVDLGHGEDAARSLAALHEAHGDLPETTSVRTPSGGLHYWFRWPDEVPDSDTGALPTWRNSGAFGPGIDVRAEGGQVAVWPSVLSDGTRYRRPKGPERSRPPQWMADQARHRTVVSTGLTVQRQDLSEADLDAAGRYGMRGVEAEVDNLRALQAAATTNPEDYRGKPWNDETFRVASRLVALANADWCPISLEDARALVFTNAPRDDGFTDETVARAWESAVRARNGEAARIPKSVLGMALPQLPGPGKDGVAAQHPDAFYDKANGLNVAMAAAAVDQQDLGIGRDGSWHVYDGGVWRSQPEVVRHRLARLLRDRYRSGGTVTSVEDYLRAAHDLPRLGAEPAREWLNLRNGMLDWATLTLHPHEPGMLSTVQFPVEWQPEATCPAFDAWVADVVPEAVAVRLWEVVAYLLLPGNPLQKAVLLYGEGGNGKGTLIRVLRGLLGTWNCASVTLRAMSEGRFEVADLLGKQANLAGDIDARYLKDSSMLKAVTGGDTVQAQRKYGQPFDFVNYATPLFSANELWRSSDNSAGYLRRWVHLPMHRKVVGVRPDFNEDALLAELPGILAHAVGMLPSLLARGAFNESVETIDAADQFAQQSDLVRTWLMEDDAVVTAEPDTERKDVLRRSPEVYARFRRWVQDNGHEGMSSMRFTNRMRALGYERVRRPDGHYYRGIVLSSDAMGVQPLVLAR